MTTDFLHNHRNFRDLLLILEQRLKIAATLIEKDYWIMHVLYSLKQSGFAFELKGGTSLSKGYRVISRFSEDIDIYIHPDPALGVVENPRKTKERDRLSRKQYYDWLAANLKIDGIVKIERDKEFDDVPNYRSGGIRLFYDAKTPSMEGIKDGILLELGFDQTAPNTPINIGSWMLDHVQAETDVPVYDNRATEIACYHPGFTFVEKLQTITRLFRQEATDGKERQNFMRQYYDIYSLLSFKPVLDFIGTADYEEHKKIRFGSDYNNPSIHTNEAFILSDPAKRERYAERYKKTETLYYSGQPPFEELLERIKAHLHTL